MGTAIIPTGSVVRKIFGAYWPQKRKGTGKKAIQRTLGSFIRGISKIDGLA